MARHQHLHAAGDRRVNPLSRWRHGFESCWGCSLTHSAVTRRQLSETKAALDYPNSDVPLGFAAGAAVVLQLLRCVDDRHTQLGSDQELCSVHDPVEVVGKL